MNKDYSISYKDKEIEINYVISQLKVGDMLILYGEKEISKYMVIGLCKNGIVEEYGLLMLSNNLPTRQHNLYTIGMTDENLFILINSYIVCLDDV